MTLPNNIITTTKLRLNKANQLCVGILTTLLILDVWLGVLDRYILRLQLVWVEEMARYIMIWAILMAVPCCTAGREHMGLEFVTKRFPEVVQRIIKIIVGAITCAFFCYIAYLGYAFAEKGASQLSTVFAMPMSYAYAAVPVTFALSGFQAFLVWLEDLYAFKLSFSQHVVAIEGEQS
ncbi:TRAP transporter small permease [Vibrio methylphosphonaticus]|uniref:TRAP transporter small permease n=1 Tax=Vibrio methylphosphonaticus TaxID=2946866 RepID=UPI002029EEFF|nr:TRAP transporter small permease [Vibrio methylphosphonaticus]MCL9773991.1 TRAP transporter small permease [Vibrio methylphosphonaticus]